MNREILEGISPQDGIDTAIIDALVERAELAEMIEPMTGLGVSLGGLSITDTMWLGAVDTKTEDYPWAWRTARDWSSGVKKAVERNTSIPVFARPSECRGLTSESLWMPIDLAIIS